MSLKATCAAGIRAEYNLVYPTKAELHQNTSSNGASADVRGFYRKDGTFTWHPSCGVLKAEEITVLIHCMEVQYA